MFLTPSCCHTLPAHFLACPRAGWSLYKRKYYYKQFTIIGINIYYYARMHKHNLHNPQSSIRILRSVFRNFKFSQSCIYVNARVNNFHKDNLLHLNRINNHLLLLVLVLLLFYYCCCTLIIVGKCIC